MANEQAEPKREAWRDKIEELWDWGYANHNEKTLTVGEVEQVVSTAIAQLEERFNAAEQSLERAIIRETEQNTQLTALRDLVRVKDDIIGKHEALNTTLRKELDDRTADWEYVRKQKDEVVALRDREQADLTALREELGRVKDGLREAQDWANRIRSDERVEGWVHQQDYGLYSLLADCPVDFDALLK
jgi:chromosome segregation ATPase